MTFEIHKGEFRFEYNKRLVDLSSLNIIPFDTYNAIIGILKSTLPESDDFHLNVDDGIFSIRIDKQNKCILSQVSHFSAGSGTFGSIFFEIK